jgi:hypothetical protein
MSTAIETLKEKKFYLEFKLEENIKLVPQAEEAFRRNIKELEYAIKLLELNLNYLK